MKIAKSTFTFEIIVLKIEKKKIENHNIISVKT